MLHTQTVEPVTLGLLNRLMADTVLRQFTLVGGTALSLQIGHRRSIDLDFFTQQDFEAASILQHLIDEGYALNIRHNKGQTLIVEISGIKVDFVRFRYPFYEKMIEINGIRMAHLKDIACMKIDAITGRGRKKDFCDLYFLLQYFSLTEIMEAYSRMFQHSTLFHVYKSLTWFEDADMDSDLYIFDKTFSWEIAKKAIIKAIEKAI